MAKTNIPALAPWRKNSPFTKEEWEELQRWRPGESKEERELRLHRARHAKRKGRDPTYRVAQTKAWREKNAVAERERAKARDLANPEGVKARQKRYYDRNRERRLENYRRWAADNRERRRQHQKEWLVANPGLNAFYSSKWRKAALRATPPWADLAAIRAIYEECARVSDETGVPHHVDHFYPLQGKTVSGLHVAENLRIIPAIENVRKQAKHPEAS